MSNNNNSSGMLQPGQTIKPPPISDENIKTLVHKLFGLTAIKIKELRSYDDKNFFIKVNDHSENSHLDEICPHGYVLKILNAMDSQNEDLIHGQNSIMLFLKSKGFNVPVPVKNLHGSLFYKENFDDINLEKNEERKYYIVRLLTFVPGKLIREVTYTPCLLYQLGNLTSGIDVALKGFTNDNISQRKFMWMLSSVPEIANFSFALKNPQRENLIEKILLDWNTLVVPRIPNLEKGFIHGDINEQNVLVSSADNNNSLYTIEGILDFGDVSYTAYVFELALAITYAMLDVSTFPHIDVGGYIIAGYSKIRTISEDEWMILKECVLARFAQSLVLGAYSHSQDSENEYLLSSSINGWKVLQILWDCPKDVLLNRWKEILRTYQP